MNTVTVEFSRAQASAVWVLLYNVMSNPGVWEHLDKPNDLEGELKLLYAAMDAIFDQTRKEP